MTTTLVDRIGGNDGTIQNAVAGVFWGKGKGLAIFDGVDEFTDHGDVLDLGTADFSIIVWGSRSNTNGPTLSKGASGEPSYFLRMNNRSRLFLEDSGGTVAVDGDITSIGTLEIHQVGVSADRDGNALSYLDGASDGSTDISSVSGTLNNADVFEIGRSRNQLVHTDGEIRSVKIYNRILTPSEFDQDYQAERKIYGI